VFPPPLPSFPALPLPVRSPPGPPPPFPLPYLPPHCRRLARSRRCLAAVAGIRCIAGAVATAGSAAVARAWSLDPPLSGFPLIADAGPLLPLGSSTQ
jgi:hypothetical protein